MDLALIEKLIIMLGQSPLQSLDVTEGNLRIRLSKAAEPAPAGSQPAAGNAIAPVANPDRLTVRAGMSGTFYRAPAPGAAPYVDIGDVVAEGAVLGLIEAMKMLNPVEAEMTGTIVAIHLGDATPIEPGAALFDIEVGAP